MPPPLESVLRRGAVFLWLRYDQLDDPALAGQTKSKFIVILSGSPLDDPILYLLTTSEKTKHAAHRFPQELLTIPAGTYRFFPLATVLDAGNAGQADIGRDDFMALYETGQVHYSGTLNDEHVTELIGLIAASKRVSPRFKRMVTGS